MSQSEQSAAPICSTDEGSAAAHPNRATYFNFMGLSGELRNVIYELLLCGRSDKKRVYPHILRISKEIYDETKDMLYIDNAMTVKASFFAFDDVFRGGRDGSKDARVDYTKELEERDRRWTLDPRHLYDEYELVGCCSESIDGAEDDNSKSTSEVEDADAEINDDSDDDSHDDSDDDELSYLKFKTGCHVLVEGDIRASCEEASVQRMAKIWPARLAEISEVFVEVTLDYDPVFGRERNFWSGEPGTDCKYEAVSWLMYSLISNMNTGIIDQKLHVSLAGRAIPHCGRFYLADLFYPLMKARKGINPIMVEGFPTLTLGQLDVLDDPRNALLTFDALRAVRAGLRLLDKYLAKADDRPDPQDNLVFWADKARRELVGMLTNDTELMDQVYERKVKKLVHVVMAVLKTEPWTEDQGSLIVTNRRNSKLFGELWEGHIKMEGMDDDITKW